MDAATRNDRYETDQAYEFLFQYDALAEYRLLMQSAPGM